MSKEKRGIMWYLGAPIRAVEGLLRKIGVIGGDGIPLKAKVIIAVMGLVVVTVGGLTAYNLYDFTQNDPKFCVSCHLMQDAYSAWEAGAHKEINCHDCHHLTIPEANVLMFKFVVHRPESVPERHGQVIVPWKTCVKCHWERDERYPKAALINGSSLHAKHYFVQQLECSKCHGYKPHMFKPEERFCTMCHTGKKVHGKGMEDLACINCHTDQKQNLRPDRDKCLFCHGSDKDREHTKADHAGSMDNRYFVPSAEVINTAIKIDIKPDSPMQFDCYTCHHPHEMNRPDWGDCFKCHRNELEVGAHGLHIKSMGLNCNNCHRPHTWRVTKEQAKTLCTKCHEYRSPESYLK